MLNDVSYSPIFKGEFPENAVSRWQAICNFLRVWCAPDNVPFPELDTYESRLICAVMDIYHK